MKKILFVLLTLSLVLSLCLFVGCKKQGSESQKQGLEKKVSTYQDGVFVGANEEFGVSFVMGEKEKLIVIDGAVGEMVPFATLTVTPLASALFNNTYTYRLVGEKGEKTGDLVKDVIGATFSAEVAGVEEIGKIQSVFVLSEGIVESEVPLADKLEGALTWREILAVAEKELKEQILAESDTDNLQREIYVKLVNALSDSEAPYYYYVSFMKSPSDYWALLLDPVTGEVVSKKV